MGPKNKSRSSNIGRRTGVNVVKGKKIRRQDDGTDMFDDYWTDSDSVYSNETIRSEHISLKSALKRTAGHRTEENEDHLADISPKRLNMLLSNRNEPTSFFEGAGNATKMTQTSYMLNEAVDTSSKNINQRSDMGNPQNERDLSDHNVNSFVKQSLRNISNSYALKENLTSPENHLDARSVLSPQKMKSVRNAKRFSFIEKSEVMTQTSHLSDKAEVSSHKNTTYTRKRSFTNEIEQNKDLLVNNKKNSIGSSRVLPETSPITNKRQNLSSRDYTNSTKVSLSSQRKSGEKIKKKNSKSVTRFESDEPLEETEGSYLKNTTCTHQRSYNETERNKGNLLNSTKSSAGSCQVLTATSPSTNKGQNLPTLSDCTDASRIILSSDRKFNEKSKDKNNSKSVTLFESDEPSDEIEDTSLKKAIFAHKRSYSDETGIRNRSSDSKTNSLVGKTKIRPEILSQPNIRENLPSLRDHTNSLKISSGAKEIAKNAQDKKHSMSMTQAVLSSSDTEGSSSENATKASKISNSKIGRNMADSLVSERKPFLKAAPKVLLRTSGSASNRKITQRDSMEGICRQLSKSYEVLKESAPSGSVNRSEVLVSNLKENQKKDSKRKVSINKYITSVERSRLSKSPSPQKIVKGKRKSFFRGKSRHSTRSSDLLSLDKSTSSKKDKSVNRSEIADIRRDSLGNSVSNLKENEKKEYKQKASIKNLTAVERSQLSKTPPNKELAKGRRKSVSGGKSRHSTKSSEPLSSDEGISSERDKSIKRSEIADERQEYNEENKRVSSVKKPTRTPTSNLIQSKQVSNTIVSPVKTASSKCRDDSPKVRRSSRMRFKPLALWRNDRLKYTLSPSGEVRCEGIVKGKEDDFALKSLGKKLHGDKKGKLEAPEKKKPKNVDRLIKKTSILDVRESKIIELNVHRQFNTNKWTAPLVNTGFMICRVFSSNMMTFGFLDIAGHGMKEKQFSPTDNVHFVVMSGQVDVEIHTTSFTFCKGDSFIVPVGNGYCISNKDSRKALLSFTSFKVPFFEFQE